MPSGEHHGERVYTHTKHLFEGLIDLENGKKKSQKVRAKFYLNSEKFNLVVNADNKQALNEFIQTNYDKNFKIYSLNKALESLNDKNFLNILKYHDDKWTNSDKVGPKGELSFTIEDLPSKEKGKILKWLLDEWNRKLGRSLNLNQDAFQSLQTSSDNPQETYEEADNVDFLGNLGPEYPEGSVPPNSPFYIERSPIEQKCYHAILQPGALIRVKAPQHMGKTLLVERLIARAQREKRYLVAVLSFNLAELTDATGMLKWLCAAVSQELELPNQITSYWDDTFGPNQNAITYFEKYILKAIQQPLILVLDNIDVVFDKAEIQKSFFRLLRHWNDITKHINHRAALWQKLSLILVHSTNKYGSLDINYSPLAGIGSEFPLSEFSELEIDELAKRYNLTNINIKEVKHYFGGHPYLVRSTFDYLHQQQVSLEHLLKIAPTEKSPFGNHLRGHLETLQKNPELGLGFKEIVTSEEPVRVSSSETFKLQSMGLVKIEGDLCSPLCELYRQYFLLRL